MCNGFYSVITLLFLFFGSTSISAQNALEKADKLYDLHAYRQAAKMYEKIGIKTGETGIAIAERLADCYWQLNNAEKAIQIYTPIVEVDKASSYALLNFGNALMSLGQYEKAETVFTKLKTTNPEVAAQMIASCRFAVSADNAVSDFKISSVSAINTPASELSANIFQNQLIWASSRTDLRRKTGNGAVTTDWTGAQNHQLFIAEVDSVTHNIGALQFYKSDFKNVFNESSVSFSADGSQVAFMRSNITDGRRITSNTGIEMSVYTARVDDSGNFLDVKPYPYNNGACGFPCLTADGQTLYFSSDRPGGFGGFDIYSARRIGSTWTEPRNLGNAINTVGDEITPYMSGKTFYFASNYHTGLGGFDIFRTTDVLGAIENMGVGINSSDDDFGFVLNPNNNTGYFVSNRAGGKGNEDIYMARGQQTNTLSNTGTVNNSALTVNKTNSKNIPSAYSANGLPNFTGIVTDASTGEPMENVVVRVKNAKTNAVTEVITDARGRYFIPLNRVSDYEVVFSKEGFVNDKKTVKPAVLMTKYIGEMILKPSAITDKDALIEETPKINAPQQTPQSYNAIVVKQSSTTIAKAGSEEISVKPHSTAPANILDEESIIVKPSGMASSGALSNVNNTTSDKKFYAVDLETAVFVAVKSVRSTAVTQAVYENYKDNNYDKLKELSGGNVYTVSTSGKKEIRLGVFTTKAKADAFVKKINTYDVPNVFTVVEEKDYKTIANNIIIEKPEPVPTSYSINVKKSVITAAKTSEVITPIAHDAESIVIKKSPDVPDTDYKVRIAAFKNPKLFDDSKLRKIGKITSVKQGNLTVFLMDGFTYFDDAHAYKKLVQEAGYKDAKVVVKEGDKFRVVD